ncbi:MAG: 5-(carboxyamino)imidazole ribonucleotide synthase [Alphaproteobacteria bacterium]
MQTQPLSPGSVIGILGGGQLARMLILAGAPLGYQFHVFDPARQTPAGQICDAKTVAAFEDETALATFADSVDVVTFEFENVPARTAEILAEHTQVRPNPGALAVAQDRLIEKTFIRDEAGIGTAPFQNVESLADLHNAIVAIGLPAVLKTRRMGYDGKGQVILRTADEAEAAWQKIDGDPAILEGFVPFTRELSVVIARGADGETASFAPVENIHSNHILDLTLAPARMDPQQAQAARAIGEKISSALDYIGVLAVELFELEDGRLLVNEIAPRVHNSGHWTINATACCQFEQHIRAVAGLPLGDPSRRHDAIMRNLIGDEITKVADYAAVPNVHVHHYGKADARPGRKMGHITFVYPKDMRPDKPA